MKVTGKVKVDLDQVAIPDPVQIEINALWAKIKELEEKLGNIQERVTPDVGVEWE